MQFIKSFRNDYGQFDYLYDIAVDSNDNIVVADYYKHHIQIFDKDGIWKQRIGAQDSGDGEFNSLSVIWIQNYKYLCLDPLQNSMINIHLFIIMKQ